MSIVKSDNPLQIVILGGAKGIGKGFVGKCLEQANVEKIYATYHNTPPSLNDDRIEWHKVDVTEEKSIQTFSDAIKEKSKSIDVLIYCIGKLHDSEHQPEKSLRQLDPHFVEDVFRTNAFGAVLTAKHFQKFFRNKHPAIFAAISAKVGSISDNRLGGWYSYRASKAALNMFLKTIALEFKHSCPKTKVLALHPGTTDTELSKPFQKNVPEGKLFPVEKTVNYLWQVMEETELSKSGSLIGWDGSVIPF